MRAKALLTIMHSTQTLDDLKIKGQPPSIRLHNCYAMIKNPKPLHPEQVLAEAGEMWVRMQAEYDLWEARQGAA